MSSYHKPKIYKSVEGCCICKAKSSSSRYTDSDKYENDFHLCFKLQESRYGDICNACVLIVKRWRLGGRKTDKNWSHVIDSKGGPGSKNTYTKQKKKKEQQKIQKTKVTTSLSKSKRKNKNGVTRLSESERNRMNSSSFLSFIDLCYWKRVNSPCGIAYRGQHGEILMTQKHVDQCSKFSQDRQMKDEPSTKPTEENLFALPTSKDIESDAATERSFGDEDEDSLSFYSDTDSNMSKLSHNETFACTDMEGDEGFYDKSSIRCFS